MHTACQRYQQTRNARPLSLQYHLQPTSAYQPGPLGSSDFNLQSFYLKMRFAVTHMLYTTVSLPLLFRCPSLPGVQFFKSVAPTLHCKALKTLASNSGITGLASSHGTQYCTKLPPLTFASIEGARTGPRPLLAVSISGVRTVVCCWPNPMLPCPRNWPPASLLTSVKNYRGKSGQS